MISIDELNKVSRIKGINNLGNAEKDYLLELVLLSISRHTKDELVFKGGTCLAKFYKLNRFSEDLDFTLIKEIDIDKLLKSVLSDLATFGIEADIKEKKKVFDSILITLKVRGLLYDGNPRSLSSIKIDINSRSRVELEPVTENYRSLYSDISLFSIQIMQEKEILAEKIRCILTREKARDVYDLWFLIGKSVSLDLDLIKSKLNYYNIFWDEKNFISKLKEEENQWDSELGALINNIPAFEEVSKEIIKFIQLHNKNIKRIKT